MGFFVELIGRLEDHREFLAAPQGTKGSPRLHHIQKLPTPKLVLQTTTYNLHPFQFAPTPSKMPTFSTLILSTLLITSALAAPLNPAGEPISLMINVQASLLTAGTSVPRNDLDWLDSEVKREAKREAAPIIRYYYGDVNAEAGSAAGEKREAAPIIRHYYGDANAEADAAEVKRDAAPIIRYYYGDANAEAKAAAEYVNSNCEASLVS
jgi:hypothetical protein